MYRVYFSAIYRIRRIYGTNKIVYILLHFSFAWLSLQVDLCWWSCCSCSCCSCSCSWCSSSMFDDKPCCGQFAPPPAFFPSAHSEVEMEVCVCVCLCLPDCRMEMDGSNDRGGEQKIRSNLLRLRRSSGSSRSQFHGRRGNPFKSFLANPAESCRILQNLSKHPSKSLPPSSSSPGKRKY